MFVSKAVLYILMSFFALGAVDRCLGNRFGLGAEFEHAFALMGRTALAVVGLVCVVPLMAKLLQPVVVPVYTLLGADAAMFSGTFLAPDSGGYAIAVELATDPRLALFSGMIVAAVMGSVISFTIPISYGLIEKEDVKYLATGVLSGFILDPLACFFGGLAMGLPVGITLRNLVPVMLVAVIIVLCLFFIPDAIIKAFRIFAKLLMILVTLGLVLGALDKVLGIVIIQGIAPANDGFLIVGSVILTLAGALPFLYVLRKVLRRPLAWIGKRIGLNDVAMVGLVFSATSIVPVFASFKDMNVRGKVVVAAVTASSANLLGAHLGYAATINQDIIGPMLLAKVIAGILAVPVAVFFSSRLFGKEVHAPLKERE